MTTHTSDNIFRVQS